MTLPLLFTPWTKRGVTLKNRVVVAPMHQYAADRGFITDWHLMNAGRFAAGGAGMVMVESTKVERRGCGTLGDWFCHNADAPYAVWQLDCPSRIEIESTGPKKTSFPASAKMARAG